MFYLLALFLLSLLNLSFIFCSNVVTSCNGHPTKNMILFVEFITAKNDETFHEIWKSVVTIDAKGSNGRVYCGYTSEEKIIGNKHEIIENCVAIKIAETHAQEQNIVNGVHILETIQNEIEEPKRKHIIGLIDYGTLSSLPPDSENSYSVLVMELGRINLRDYLILKQHSDEIEMDKDELMKIITTMAIPLKELHQMAVHLDYKLDNLVYVPNTASSARQTLHLIDFDRAVLIPKNSEPFHEIEEENNTANTSIEIKHSNLLNSGRYSSPETFEINGKLSAKTDIWSFGISVYETIMLAKTKYVKKETDIPTILNSIASLHRGFLTDQNGNKLEEINFSNNNWILNQNLNEFKLALKIILNIWKDYPKIALLIMSALQVNPLERITAIGIIEFMNDRCTPVKINGNGNGNNNNNVSPTENVHIFPNLTLRNLEQQFFKLMHKQNKQCSMIQCAYFGRKSNLHNLLRKVIRKIDTLINELNAKKEDIALCDTINVIFN